MAMLDYRSVVLKNNPRGHEVGAKPETPPRVQLPNILEKNSG